MAWVVERKIVFYSLSDDPEMGAPWPACSQAPISSRKILSGRGGVRVQAAGLAR